MAIQEHKMEHIIMIMDMSNVTNSNYTLQYTYGVAPKNGAILSHCKYSENSMTELRGNWWTSAILYAEHSH